MTQRCAVFSIIALACILCGCATLTPVPQLQPATGNVTALRWSPDASLIASAADDGSVRIWSSSTGQLLATSHGYAPPNNNYLPTGLAFSPDNQSLAFGGDAGVVRLWNFRAGQTVEFPGHSRVINQVGFTPDGNQLYTASGGFTYLPRNHPNDPFTLIIQPAMVIVFDVRSRQILSRIDASGFFDITFSPDGCYFAGLVFPTSPSTTWPLTWGDSEVRNAVFRLCRTSDGEKLADLAPPRGVARDFSPDGKFLLAGDSIYEIASHRLIRQATQPVIFTQDSQFVIEVQSGVGLPRDGFVASTRWVKLDYLNLSTGRERNLGTFVDNGLSDALWNFFNASCKYSPDRRFAINRQLEIWKVPR